MNSKNMAYFPFLDLTITFDLLSGIVALLVSYYAFRYNRLLENSTLKFISFGFMLLGLGLLAESFVEALVIFGIGDIFTARILAISTSSLYHLLQIAAYFVFAIGYIRGAYSSSSSYKAASESTSGSQGAVGATASASAVLVLVSSSGLRRLQQMAELSRAVSLVSEILTVVFLSMVVFQGTLIHAQSRNRLALFVLLSFVLILVAHLVFLGADAFSSLTWSLVAGGIQFAGFLSLLIFLLWRSRIGSAGKAAQ